MEATPTTTSTTPKSRLVRRLQKFKSINSSLKGSLLSSSDPSKKKSRSSSIFTAPTLSTPAIPSSSSSSFNALVNRIFPITISNWTISCNKDEKDDAFILSGIDKKKQQRHQWNMESLKRISARQWQQTSSKDSSSTRIELVGPPSTDKKNDNTLPLAQFQKGIPFNWKLWMKKQLIDKQNAQKLAEARASFALKKRVADSTPVKKNTRPINNHVFLLPLSAAMAKKSVLAQWYPFYRKNNNTLSFYGVMVNIGPLECDALLRLDSYCFRSVSGHVRELSGPMDISAARRHNVPESVISYFRNGIPESWVSGSSEPFKLLYKEKAIEESIEDNIVQENPDNNNTMEDNPNDNIIQENSDNNTIKDNPNDSIIEQSIDDDGDVSIENNIEDNVIQEDSDDSIKAKPGDDTIEDKSGGIIKENVVDDDNLIKEKPGDDDIVKKSIRCNPKFKSPIRKEESESAVAAIVVSKASSEPSSSSSGVQLSKKSTDSDDEKETKELLKTESKSDFAKQTEAALTMVKLLQTEDNSSFKEEKSTLSSCKETKKIAAKKKETSVKKKKRRRRSSGLTLPSDRRKLKTTSKTSTSSVKKKAIKTPKSSAKKKTLVTPSTNSVTKPRVIEKKDGNSEEDDLPELIGSTVDTKNIIIESDDVSSRRRRSGRQRMATLEWWRCNTTSSNKKPEAVVVETPELKDLKKSKSHTIISESTTWTKRQLNALKEAKNEIQATHPQFWNQVALHVDGKNASECQSKYFEQFKSPSNVSRKRKETSPKILEEKLAGKKTKKFKRQVRSYVKQSEENHADDAFEQVGRYITPGKGLVASNSNSLKTPKSDEKIKQVSEDDDEDDDFEDENCYKSPGILHVLNSKERNEVDSYVADLKKKNVKNSKSYFATPKRRKISESVLETVTTNSGRVIEGKITPGGTTRVEITKGNEDEDDDMIFSEDDSEVSMEF